MIDLIAFDADDTLWINEPRYIAAEAKLREFLAPYAADEVISQRLHETEVRNLGILGYGVKGYIISMIETAIEVSNEQVTGTEIAQILQVGRQMLEAPVQLFDHVEETVAALAKTRDLMVITKGDLVEQEDRIKRSGLTQYFRYIEIVSEKTEDTYREILRKYTIQPEHFIMVGNSMRSDILPVVALGGQAVYIHYEDTWQYENAHAHRMEYGSYEQIDHIGLLPELIKKIESCGEFISTR
jgi:putative hydrolase of the HAD superfamily